MSINMVSDLDRTKFNDEFKVDFERDVSLLKKTTRNDGMPNAGTIQWDVVDPSDVALERTRDGDIPESQLGLSKVTAVPKEVFKKYRIDTFDAFKSNPNIRTQHYKKIMSSINRAIDQLVIDQLDGTSVAINSGSAASFATLATVLDWTSTLWAKDVPNDGKVWGVVTPRAMAQFMRINEFKSVDFVTVRPAENGIPALGYRRWMDVNWMVHTGLTGIGTSTAKCYLYHESAIGHCISGDPEMHTYFYEPQKRYESYGSVMHAAKVCLPRGIVRAVHDDTAAFA